MLGAILGDIIGSVYEWDNLKSTDFPLFSADCRFTDDTVLTAAVAKALMDTLGQPEAMTKVCLIRELKRFARRYPGAGYGGSYLRWMLSENPQPYNSWGNGSGMRVSAVGWLYDTLAETRRMAALTASVTHNHPEGIKGAESVAAAIFLARTGHTKAEIRADITEQFGYDLDTPLDELRPAYTFDVSCQGSVPQAIRAFLEGTDYESTVRLAVSLGGDSDTIACMAGGIAEAMYGLPRELAEEGLRRLPDDLREQVLRLRTVSEAYGKRC